MKFNEYGQAQMKGARGKAVITRIGFRHRKTWSVACFKDTEALKADWVYDGYKRLKDAIATAECFVDCG